MKGGEGWSFFPASEDPPPAPAPDPSQARARVRMERRMGKAVTVVTGLQACGTERLEAIARRLKAAMGCGGTVKDGCIEIQGDKTDAVRAWFERNGDAVR